MALFEGLIFGGAYLRIASQAGVFRGARFLSEKKRLRGRLIYGGKFAFQNRLGQRYRWKEIYSFCFVLLCICLRAISRYKPPGSLYLEGRFNGGSFALRVQGVLPKSASFRNRFLISLPKGLAQSFSVFSSSCIQLIYGGPCHGKTSLLIVQRQVYKHLWHAFAASRFCLPLKKDPMYISYPYLPRPRGRNI